MDNEIIINGETFVKKTAGVAVDDNYCMVRTSSAGVFCGEITAVKDDTVMLDNARRIWYWEGAASLSQLAMEGTKKPEACKFPCVVPKIKLFGVIEIIPMTTKAIESIAGVPVWEA